MITKTDSAIIVETGDTSKTWCVYEHHVILTPGEPPETIMIGACRLCDVYNLSDGKKNSEWIRIFEKGGTVLVRIVATTPEKTFANRHAMKLLKEMENKPRCNIFGYDLRHSSRAIKCVQSGERYATQSAAALALGIPASSISRHLNGELKTAGGFNFHYVDERDRS